jgi:hypothetical protein
MYELMTVVYQLFVIMMCFSLVRLFLGYEFSLNAGWEYYVIVLIVSSLLLVFWRKYTERFRKFLSVIVLFLGFLIIFTPLSLSHYTYTMGFLFGMSCAFVNKSLHHGVRLLTIPIKWFYKDREVKGWHYLLHGLLYIPLCLLLVIPARVFLDLPGMVAPDYWYGVVLPIIFFGNPPVINVDLTLSLISSYVGFLFGVAGSYAVSYLTGSEIMEGVEPPTYAYPEAIMHNLKFIVLIVGGFSAPFLPLSIPIVRCFLELFLGDLGYWFNLLLNIVSVLCVLLVIGVIIHASRGKDYIFD